MLNILFLASNPSDSPELGLESEYNRLREVLRESKHGDQIRLDSRWDVRPDQLLKLLEEYQPHIVHFSGHSTAEGELRLEGIARETRLVDAALLRKVFRVARGNIHLVLLNACETRRQGQDLSEVIDCVIAMARPITDSAARIFTEDFYRAFGRGDSVDAAFEHARLQLQLTGLPEDDTPQIFARPGTDPREINFINLRFNKLTGPKPAAVRKQLAQRLPEIGQFDAFVSECFPDVYRRFSTNADRLNKENLLLTTKKSPDVADRLEKYLAEQEPE